MSYLRFCFTLPFLLAATASAWSKSPPIQIKVHAAESSHFQAPPLTPPDRNWRDLSAYCYSSAPQTYIQHTMVIQEPKGKSLEIGCIAFNLWSRCTTLPVNQSFQAWVEKHSVKIAYVDEHRQNAQTGL